MPAQSGHQASEKSLRSLRLQRCLRVGQGLQKWVSAFQIFVLGLFILQGPQALATSPQCQEVFKTLVPPKLLDRAIVNLAELQLSLDIAQSIGTQSPVVTALLKNLKQREKEIGEYVKQHRLMSPAQLTERIKQEIQILQGAKQAEQRQALKDKEEEERRRKDQQNQAKNVVIDGTRAVLHRVEPGSFKMGPSGEKVDVILTKPFDMMATPTTQVIWRKVAELANSQLGLEIDVDPSYFKGDRRPVEQVSSEDIQIWLNALNELSKRGETALVDIIPSHQKGDIYRLPTEAEWESVVRGRGQFNDIFYFGNDESQLGDHAWCDLNSGARTQPVAEKKPLEIGDKKFYDMIGNVWELVLDGYTYTLLGGTDPQSPVTTSSRTRRGGGWKNHGSSSLRQEVEGSKRDNDMGFRFVREAF